MCVLGMAWGAAAGAVSIAGVCTIVHSYIVHIVYMHTMHIHMFTDA